MVQDGFLEAQNNRKLGKRVIHSHVTEKKLQGVRKAFDYEAMEEEKQRLDQIANSTGAPKELFDAVREMNIELVRLQYSKLKEQPMLIIGLNESHNMFTAMANRAVASVSPSFFSQTGVHYEDRCKRLEWLGVSVNRAVMNFQNTVHGGSSSNVAANDKGKSPMYKADGSLAKHKLHGGSSSNLAANDEGKSPMYNVDDGSLAKNAEVSDAAKRRTKAKDRQAFFLELRVKRQFKLRNRRPRTSRQQLVAAWAAKREAEIAALEAANVALEAEIAALENESVNSLEDI